MGERANGRGLRPRAAVAACVVVAAAGVVLAPPVGAAGTGTVSVIAVEADGTTPAPQVQVEVQQEFDGFWDVVDELTTDDDGLASMVLPAGDYRFRAFA